jgi:hypothetical protein
MTTGDLLEQLYEIPGVIMEEPNYFAGKTKRTGKTAMMEKKAVTGNMEKSRRAYRMAPECRRAVRMRLQPLGNLRGILRRSNGI